MQMNEEMVKKVLVLKLDGELMGGDDAPVFQERIYRAIREDTVNVVVDMKNVQWMNSSGLGILMAGLTTLRGSEGDLRLSELSERVQRPIEVTKLDQVILIFQSVTEAVNSYESGE